MSDERTMTATEFKATCLDVFEQLADRKLSQVTITKRGRPVAVVTPPPVEQPFVSRLYGALEGRVHIPEGLDLTAPVLDEPLDAEPGILHR